jgi:hypothetical protein
MRDEILRANTTQLPKVRTTKSQKLSIIILVCLLLAALAAAGYYYHKYTQIRNNPSSVAANQVSTVESRVGKLIALPTGEAPTLATVQDPTKLASQPFFKNAKKGDQLLIYTNAKEAILYRPSTNKIINVGPLDISNNTSSSTSTTAK